MELSHSDRVFLSATAGISATFALAGHLNTATAVLLVPLFARAGLVVVDVFWTSFTGRPLLRARGTAGQPEAEKTDEEAGDEVPADAAVPQLGPFGKLSVLPAPLRAPEPRRVALFDPKDARPGPPSRRLRARKARLGFF